MVAKKKSAVYSVVALMLCMAVYLNWSYTKDRPDAEYNEAGEFEDSKILGEAKLVDETEQIEESEVRLTAKDNPNISPVPSDYFSEARLARQKARDESVNILSETANNANASEDAKATAVAAMGDLAENAEKEARIESLVVAKGYRQCVVFINDEGANVIVEKTNEGLQNTDLARIKEIVLNETNLTAEQVKVIETA
ncbi:MAG: SpoIIIAH-like family protein [Ruminococcaceae bacterium]|nr:SpoIIIAH-like family protein [Oscillospiraceae bacterium]